MDPQQRTAVKPRIVILFAILAIPPLIIGPLVLMNSSAQIHREVIGSHLSSLAEQSQLALSSHLQDLISRVASLATVPEIRSVVDRHNRTPVSEQSLTEEVQAVEALWQGMIPANSRTLRNILEDPAARFLREYQQLTPSFREILVTDRYGRLIAATNKPSDYFQADEQWWLSAYRQGAGGHFISGIQYDESAGLFALEVSEPVMDRLSGSAVGIIKVIVDPQQIFTLVNSIDPSQSGRGILIGPEGIILVSQHYTVADHQPHPHAPTIRAAVESGQDWVEMGEGDDGLVLGLPNSALKETFPALDWHLIIQEPTAEAYRPFRNVNRYFIVLVLFSVGTVIVLALIFSWYLSKPVVESDPHLDQI